MDKQTIAVTLLALAAMSYGQIDGWTDCGTVGATIHSINVGQCGQVPCSFVRGNTYDIRIIATAVLSSYQLPFNVTATFFGLEAVVMSGNVCEHMSCPTQVGDTIEFGYSYTVSEIFPPISSTISTRVWDHADELTMCFTIPIQIQ